MKRKILLLTAMIFVIASFTACGKEKKEEQKSVKDDLIELVGTEIPDAEKKEIEAMNTYNGYFAGESEVDTAALLADLENTIIPKYKEFMTSVEAIEVEFDEVTAIKELYYSSMDYQLQALLQVEEALKEEDADYQNEAAALLEQAEGKYAEYLAAVEKLASENNVTIKNNSSIAASQNDDSTEKDSDTEASEAESSEAEAE